MFDFHARWAAIILPPSPMIILYLDWKVCGRGSLSWLSSIFGIWLGSGSSLSWKRSQHQLVFSDDVHWSVPEWRSDTPPHHYIYFWNKLNQIKFKHHFWTVKVPFCWRENGQKTKRISVHFFLEGINHGILYSSPWINTGRVGDWIRDTGNMYRLRLRTLTQPGYVWVERHGRMVKWHH